MNFSVQLPFLNTGITSPSGVIPSFIVAVVTVAKSHMDDESFTPLCRESIKRILAVILMTFGAKPSAMWREALLVKQRVGRTNAEVRDGRVVGTSASSPIRCASSIATALQLLVLSALQETAAVFKRNEKFSTKLPWQDSGIGETTVPCLAHHQGGGKFPGRHIRLKNVLSSSVSPPPIHLWRPGSGRR